MPEFNRWLVAGLGNPGREYAKTRHNVGFMVLDRLAEKNGIGLTQNKFKNKFGVGDIQEAKVILAKPQAFMNLSGPPVHQLSSYFNITPEHILVIHDDIDLVFGQIKIKTKGGHGGHNGIKSIINALGCGDFPRIRIGIGRPETKDDVTDHVLGKFSSEEIELIQAILKKVEDAAMMILTRGVTQGMNNFNKKPFTL